MAEPLTTAKFAARHPAYGLAGDRIAFACDRASDQPPTTMEAETLQGLPPAGRRWNIFTMANDGTDVRQVTHGNHVDQRPSLSPDGSMIAFVSDRGPGIWLVPADGSGEPTCLSRGDIVLYRPCWAITGNEIFCSGFRANGTRSAVSTWKTVTGNRSRTTTMATPMDRTPTSAATGFWRTPIGTARSHFGRFLWMAQQW